MVRTAPGAVVGERYRLVRQIAVGGMGEVWEGHDESLDRPVAVKVLRAEYAGDATFLARFRTEARNSAALSHPNIAALFDYGEEGGQAFLVQELVDGEPLSDLLERERMLPPARLLPLLSQAARGLHYAHHLGVVHRDVKPGNLLITGTGRLKITDFGVSLAQDQTPMTATGMVMGTAQYLSPEQAVGRPATPLSDLYALGIVAYEALVGHRPFTGGSAVDIAVAQVNDPVPPLPRTVDPALAALVVRLLAKDPLERPASGAEVAGLFDALVPHTPAQGVPTTPTPPRATPLRPASASSRGQESADQRRDGAPADAIPAGRRAVGTSWPARDAATPPVGPLPPSFAPSATRRTAAGQVPPDLGRDRRHDPAPVGTPAARPGSAPAPTPARRATPAPAGSPSPAVRRRRALLTVVVVLLALLLAVLWAGQARADFTSSNGAAAAIAVSAPGVPGYPRRDVPHGDRLADPASPIPVGRDGSTVKDA